MQVEDTTMSPEQLKKLGNSIAVEPGDMDALIASWDVEPMGQRVFVAKLPSSEKYTPLGNIIMTEEAAARNLDGVIVAAGPIAFVNRTEDFDQVEYMRFRDFGSNIQEATYAATLSRLKPGDKVNMANWSGETATRTQATIKHTVCIMNAEDCLGDVKEQSNGS